ncbi:MAG: hypothetical protein A2Y86_04710 [Candidatus Aminicenantes bacterium RBG_13_62_12]|nr:MAG: hypothetical protein A2Y86_04710 [Candidatus Aminicenantes bacterium RBG_13_62_12]
MNRVVAPAGFEEGVMAKLPAARKERARVRRANFRYAFAGTAGLILVGFVLLNPSLFLKEPMLTFADREAPTVPSIPVFETMDYASEFRNAQSQSRTVYILEQVSESVSSEIIY